MQSDKYHNFCSKTTKKVYNNLIKVILIMEENTVLIRESKNF